jgi:dipeptidyl aminopeptidase/acylaminoacyl peptidase
MCNWKQTAGVLIAISALTSAASAQTRPSAHKPQLTIEQLIDIKHPSDPIWSPSGKLIAFVWDRAGVSNLYVANVDGSGEPKPLTTFSEGQVEGAFWSEDSDLVYFRTKATFGRSPFQAALPSRFGANRTREVATFPHPMANV